MKTKESLNSLNAKRKSDREKIVANIAALAATFGAEFKRDEYSDREITVHVLLSGVGAMIGVGPLHGGGRALISWHNDRSGGSRVTRNFSPSFNKSVRDPNYYFLRAHHKATSFPDNWGDLMELLESGLLLAKSGDAFQL